MGDKIRTAQRWFLTEERNRVVPEDDPAARWLHWRKGDYVEVSEALRLGAIPAKRLAASPNKMRRNPSDNKGR